MVCRRKATILLFEPALDDTFSCSSGFYLGAEDQLADKIEPFAGLRGGTPRPR